jgi:hypothetical protein
MCPVPHGLCTVSVIGVLTGLWKWFELYVGTWGTPESSVGSWLGNSKPVCNVRHCVTWRWQDKSVNITDVVASYLNVAWTVLGSR